MNAWLAENGQIRHLKKGVDSLALYILNQYHEVVNHVDQTIVHHIVTSIIKSSRSQESQFHDFKTEDDIHNPIQHYRSRG